MTNLSAGSTYYFAVTAVNSNNIESDFSDEFSCKAPELSDEKVTATEKDKDRIVNLALASRGSTITGSNGAKWTKLIDGVTTGYAAGTGYGYTY